MTAKQQGREWLMTRIPAKLFRDYSSKGPLFTVGMYVCMYVCMHVSMYVCMYVRIYVSVELATSLMVTHDIFLPTSSSDPQDSLCSQRNVAMAGLQLRSQGR